MNSKNPTEGKGTRRPQRPVDDRLVKLPPSNPTPAPLSKKAPDKPLDERVWRVPPRKPTPNPTRRKP